MTSLPQDSPEMRDLGPNDARGNWSDGSWVGIWFGLPFVIIGAGVIMVSADLISIEDRSFHAPRWVVAIVGCVFMLAGLTLMVASALGIRRIRRLDDLRVACPEDAWRGDHEWQAFRSTDENNSRIVKYCLSGLFAGLLGAPFLYLGIHDGTWLFGIGGAVCAMVALAAFYAATKNTVRWLWYGGGTVVFEQMPLKTGTSINLKWRDPKAIGRYHKFVFRLRCIQERIHIEDSSDDVTQVYHRHLLWEETQELRNPLDYAAGQYLSLHFNIPSGLPGTGLRLDPPRYWTLEVSAVTRVVDLQQRFLIPIYAHDEDLVEAEVEGNQYE